MANTVIGASVEIEYKSIGDLRQEITKTTAEVEKLMKEFGEGSDEVVAAQKRLSSVQDMIAKKTEQQNENIDNAAKTISALSAAYGGLQGALELTGLAGEDTMKQLAKIQSAMAIGDAIQNLAEFRGAIVSTFTMLKDSAVSSFKAIRGAIGATGIGLLVVALGAIVAYWDDIKEAVSGVSEEQKKLNEDSAKNVELQKEKMDALALQENSLKLQGKTEREILELKIKQTDEQIKASEIQIQNTIATTKAQVEAAQRNKDILQGILTFISSPIAALLKGIDLIGEAVGKNFDLYNKFYGGISSFIFDPEQVQEEGNAAVKEQENALKQLQSQRDGFLLQRKQIDKEAAKTASDNQAKINAEALKNQQEADKLLEEIRLSMLTSRQLAEEEVLKKFEERKKVLQAAGIKDLSVIEQQRDSELKALRKQFNDEDLKLAQDFQDQLSKIITDRKLISDKDARVKEIDDLKKSYEEQRKVIDENEKLTFEQRFILLASLKENERLAMQELEAKFESEDNEKKIADLEKQLEEEGATFDRKRTILDEELILFQAQLDSKAISEEQYNERVKNLTKQRIDIAEQEANARIEFAQAVGDSLGTLSDIVGKQTAEGKALAIAQATINTFLGVTEVLRAQSVLPEPAGTIMKIVQTAAIVASGISAITEIVNTPIPNEGAGGGGAAAAISGAAPVASIASPTVVAQTLNTQAINQLGNQSMRAYVLNSDMQNNDQRNAYLQRNARIG